MISRMIPVGSGDYKLMLSVSIRVCGGDKETVAVLS